MNPEENNPLNNSGAASSNPGGMPGVGGLSMADTLSSAEDNLTSAGLAAPMQNDAMGLDQIGQPEAVMTPPTEEPLIPAAPVPGSIGSAISVPPAPAEPMAAPAFGNAAESQAPADTTATPVPETAPQASMPFNPFANNATQAATPTANPVAAEPASNNNPMTPINPAFQPAPAPKAAKKSGSLKEQFNTLTLLFAILSAVLLVIAIIFFVLFNNAKNNPKVVYVPQISEEESTGSIEVLTCSRETDYGYLADYDHPAMGTDTVVASYTDGELRGLTVDYRMNFDDENGAGIANENFHTQQDALMAIVGNSFTTEYLVEGNILNVNVESSDNLSEADARAVLYGSNSVDTSIDLDTVESAYTANGYNCSAQ